MESARTKIGEIKVKENLEKKGLKKKWIKVIRKDMRECGVDEDLDRVKKEI